MSHRIHVGWIYGKSWIAHLISESLSRDSLFDDLSTQRDGRPGNLSSIPGRFKRSFILQMVQTRNGAGPALYSINTGKSFSGGKGGRVVKLTIYLQVPRWIISGTIPLVPLPPPPDNSVILCFPWSFPYHSATLRSIFGQPCYGNYMQDSICNCSNCSWVGVG